MKILLLIFSCLVALNLADPAWAQVVDNPIEIQKTTYYQICEIRRIFCGRTSIVIAAAMIFAIGILILVGKAKWILVFICLLGMCIFMSAEYMMEMLTTPPAGYGVRYACYC